MWGKIEIGHVPNIMAVGCEATRCKNASHSKIAAFLSYVGFAPTWGKVAPLGHLYLQGGLLLEVLPPPCECEGSSCMWSIVSPCPLSPSGKALC